MEVQTKNTEEEGLFIARPNPQFQSCPVILNRTRPRPEGNRSGRHSVHDGNVSLILNRGVAGSAILNQGRLKLQGGVIANNSLASDLQNFS